MKEALLAKNQHYSWQKLTGCAIKIIAVITMLIDHVAASLIEPRFGWIDANVSWFPAGALTVDHVMRYIGRIAFPIYCFLIVEGMTYTKSKFKYARNMLIFALISEVPFDMAFLSSYMDWSHQNVFWTLLLGVLAIWGLQYTDENCRKVNRAVNSDGSVTETVAGYTGQGIAIRLVATFGTMAVALLFRTDYNLMGVAAILVLYLLRGRQLLQCIVGALFFFFCVEIYWTVFIAFFVLLFYNGKRGRQFKYFFYGFYPVHLLILGILNVLVLPK
jgi:hypothetical protein